MAAVGSLRVELEFQDGSFTTRVMRAGTTLRQLEQQTGQTITAVRRLDSTFSQVGGGIRDFVLTLGLARAAVENVATVFGGLPVSILRTAGEIERLTTLLTGMSTAATDAARALEGASGAAYVRELAQRTPFALEALTAGFVRLRAAGIEPTSGAFQGLIDAVAAFGGSREQFDRATVAIQQMAGKGVISLEELRQQLGEAVPNAIPLMARAMGTTVAQLVEQIALGRVRAAPALDALSREFERTFGGAAQRQMETFRGQLQLLQTNWQNWQVIAAGKPGSGGFLDAATDAVRRFNEILSSPEGQGLGIRLGLMLRDVTEGFAKLVETAMRFRTEIGIALQVGAVAIGLRMLQSLLMTLAVSINVMTGGLAASAIRLAATALSFSNLAFAAGYAGAAVAHFGAIAVAGLARGMVGLTFGIGHATVALYNFIAAPLAVTAAAATSAAASMGAAFARLGATLAAGSIGVVGFRLALLTLGVAGGAGLIAGVTIGIGSLIGAVSSLGPAFGRAQAQALSAMSAMGQAASYLFERVSRLFNDNSQVPERLRMGAIDTDTIERAMALLPRLEAAHRRASDNITSLMEANARRQRTAGVLTIDGAGLVGDQIRNNVNADEFDTELTRNLQIQERAARLEAELRENIETAKRNREVQLARQWADARVAETERSYTGIRAVYNAAELAIAEELSNLRSNEALSHEQREEQTNDVIRRQMENRAELYRKQERVLADALLGARRSLVENAGDETQQRRFTTLVTTLEQRLAEVRQRAAETGQTLANAMMGGNAGATIGRQAQTRIDNMSQRLAQMREEAISGHGALARINQLLTQADWDKLPETTKKRMRELAQQTDAATAALERQKVVRQSMSRIEDGFNRSAADLQAYSMAIQNPALPEAQAAFVRFSQQMAVQLMQVGLNAGFMSAQFITAAAAVAQAVGQAQAASALGAVDALGREGDAARISALTPAERAAEQTRQATARITAARASVEEALAKGVITQEQYTAALTRLDGAQRDLQNSFENRAGRAAASAGRAQENQIDRLRGRLEEMRSEIRTGTGEFAKLWGQMSEAERTSAAGQQILNMARQLDEMAQNAEAARAAWSALDEIIRKGAGGQAAAQAHLAQLGQGREGREIIEAQAKINAARAALENGVGDPAVLAERVQAAEVAMTGIRAESAARQAVQMQEQSRQLRASLAGSVSERRAMSMQALELERTQYETTVRYSNMTEQQRALALGASAENYALRRQQALQETENGLEKMMREWGKLADNTWDSMASGLDKLTDGLVEFATTGKANFADLSKSILAELAKIQLRAAMSGIFNMIGGISVGGASAGGAGGTVGTVGTGNQNFMGYAGTWHTGGIPGVDVSRLPTYHTGGLAGDEILAKLQIGEGVFTEGQMAAIGRMNHSYTAIEAGMAQLVRALPAATAPRNYAEAPSAGRAGGAMPPVTVNLMNESGQQLDAMAGTPYMDMEGMVVDVVIRNASRPGPLRDLMRGA